MTWKKSVFICCSAYLINQVLSGPVVGHNSSKNDLHSSKLNKLSRKGSSNLSADNPNSAQSSEANADEILSGEQSSLEENKAEKDDNAMNVIQSYGPSDNLLSNFDGKSKEVVSASDEKPVNPTDDFVEKDDQATEKEGYVDEYNTEYNDKDDAINSTQSHDYNVPEDYSLNKFHHTPKKIFSGSHENLIANGDLVEDDNQEPGQRRLKVGDYVTPQDFLSVSEKLIAKVEKPGEGKGIVSSSKNPKVLAEKLFRAYFRVPNRLAIVKDYDLAGIDALQALALSGQEVDAIEEGEKGNAILRGQNITVKRNPNESKYTVITKKINPVPRKNKKPKSKRVLRKDLEKAKRLAMNLALKGQLPRKGNKNFTIKAKRSKIQIIRNNKTIKQKNIVEVSPKTRKTELNLNKDKNSNNRKNNTSSTGKRTSVKRICSWNYECNNPNDIDTCELKARCQNEKSGQNKTKSGLSCRWKYECTNDADLRTCHLMPKCVAINETSKEIFLPHNLDEKSPAIKSFRKMLGISLVDEEVEKILERRSLDLQAKSPGIQPRIESLTEYFQRILETEYKGKSEQEAMIDDVNDDDNDQPNKDGTDGVVNIDDNKENDGGTDGIDEKYVDGGDGIDDKNDPDAEGGKDGNKEDQGADGKGGDEVVDGNNGDQGGGGKSGNEGGDVKSGNEDVDGKDAIDGIDNKDDIGNPEVNGDKDVENNIQRSKNTVRRLKKKN